MSAAGNSARAGEAGFTLIELMAVLVVAGLLGGLAMPVFAAASDALRLQTSARALAADLRAARGAALLSGVAVSVLLDPEARGYRLAGGGAPVTLPDGVALRFTPGPLAAGPLRLDFLPDGSASGGDVVLAGPREAALVAVAPMTGAIVLGRVR